MITGPRVIYHSKGPRTVITFKDCDDNEELLPEYFAHLRGKTGATINKVSSSRQTPVAAQIAGMLLVSDVGICVTPALTLKKKPEYGTTRRESLVEEVPPAPVPLAPETATPVYAFSVYFFFGLFSHPSFVQAKDTRSKRTKTRWTWSRICVFSRAKEGSRIQRVSASCLLLVLPSHLKPFLACAKPKSNGMPLHRPRNPTLKVDRGARLRRSTISSLWKATLSKRSSFSFSYSYHNHPPIRCSAAPSRESCCRPSKSQNPPSSSSLTLQGPISLAVRCGHGPAG